jgi:hypothetical protein
MIGYGARRFPLAAASRTSRTHSDLDFPALRAAALISPISALSNRQYSRACFTELLGSGGLPRLFLFLLIKTF